MPRCRIGSDLSRIRGGPFLSNVGGVTAADPRIEYATGARLRPWSRVWRYLVVIAASALAWIITYGIIAAEIPVSDLPGGETAFILALVDPVVCLIALGLLPLRRRAPLTIAS